MERIKFCFVDKFDITYPPEEVVCDLCNKVVKFKDMSEHRRYCPPADWKIPMEGDKNEFIVLTAYYTGITKYVNINHIVCYYKDDDRTQIDLLSGKGFGVRETCEQVKKLIDEVTTK